MKKILFLFVFILLSCSSVRVVTDYDSSANFNSYNSYAFSKQEINKLEISDIDKKRILSSIEQSMNLKGYNFSNSPDCSLLHFKYFLGSSFITLSYSVV